MSDNEIHVGDHVELTADISVLGLITLHAGIEGEVLSVHGDVALVKFGGMLGVTAQIDLTANIIVKVG